MERLTRRRGWHTSKTRGEAITAWSRQITPVGRLFQFNWPGGAFVWHRPVAVEVRQGDTVQRLPIHDVTLYAIMPIVLTGLMIALVAPPLLQWVRSQRRRRA